MTNMQEERSSGDRIWMNDSRLCIALAGVVPPAAGWARQGQGRRCLLRWNKLGGAQSKIKKRIVLRIISRLIILTIRTKIDFYNLNSESQASEPLFFDIPLLEIIKNLIKILM